MAVLANDPDVINQVIAQRVNLELGVAIDARRVGEIRRSLGIGTTQMIWAKLGADLVNVPFGPPYNADLNLKVIAILTAANCISTDEDPVKSDVIDRMYTILCYLLDPEFAFDRERFLTTLVTTQPPHFF